MSELSDTVAPTFNKVIKQVIKEGDPATDIANAFITDRPGNRIDTSTATLIELNPDAYDAVVLYQDQYGKTAVIVKSNKVVFYGMEVERMDNIGNAALRQTT
jgi:TATA-box binding protein (TBP) (component of TFIID and TFIIIB)|tara:strand:+ start:385 stop:690 length:306 start_codon:yes stop_codon:yes gene_type:complete